MGQGVKRWDEEGGVWWVQEIKGGVRRVEEEGYPTCSWRSGQGHPRRCRCAAGRRR